MEHNEGTKQESSEETHKLLKTTNQRLTEIATLLAILVWFSIFDTCKGCVSDDNLTGTHSLNIKTRSILLAQQKTYCFSASDLQKLLIRQ